jgi:hypothetical protein
MLEVGTQVDMRLDVINHLMNALKQARVVHLRLSDLDTVLFELASFADKSGGVRQNSDRHGSVGGGHTTECIARDKRRMRAQLGRT